VYFPFVIFNFLADCSNLDGRKVSQYAANSFLGGCWRVDEVIQGVGHAIAGMIIYSDEKRVGVVVVVIFWGSELFQVAFTVVPKAQIMVRCLEIFLSIDTFFFLRAYL